MLKFKPKFLESSSKSTYDKDQYYKPKNQFHHLQAFDEFVFVFECQIHMSMCILTILTTRPILKLKYMNILEMLFLFREQAFTYGRCCRCSGCCNRWRDFFEPWWHRDSFEPFKITYSNSSSGVTP